MIDLDEGVRLPLLRELPIVLVVVKVMVFVLGLNFDRHWYLNCLHDRLGVHVGVMFDWDMDSYPEKYTKK